MLFLEDTRRQLISKSLNVDKVKSYGTTRYERRHKQTTSKNTKLYNKVDFNALFRANLLSFMIPVKGETNKYEVEILMEGICDEIYKELKRNKFQMTYNVIYRALLDAMNRKDIMIGCSCPDWKFRMAYWATKGQFNGSRIENRPAKITNPKNSKGIGCKHVMAVLDDNHWIQQLALSVYNYIEYMRQNYHNKYARIIYPAIYKRPYRRDVEDDGDNELANTMDKPEDAEIVDKANENSGEED